MDPSLRRTAWTSRYSFRGTACTGRRSVNRWKSSRTNRHRSSHVCAKKTSNFARWEKSDDDEITEPAAAQRAHESSAAAHAGTGGTIARDKFHGSESGLFDRTRATGSGALPGVCQAGMYTGLSGGREGERLRAADSRRGFLRRGREDSRRQRATRHYRPRLSAGGPLRRRLPDGEKSSVAWHRL